MAAVRVALTLGLARALTLVTDHAEQATKAASSVCWEDEKIWESETEPREGGSKPLIVLNAIPRPFNTRFRCAHPCTISTREEDMPRADAYVMNFCFPRKMMALPDDKPEGQKWVFSFDFEAASDRLCYASKGRLPEGLGRIDWTMTYKPDSDIWRPLFSLEPRKTEEPDFKSNWFDFSFKNSTVPNPNQIDWSAGRDKLVLWFVSNCQFDRMVRAQRLQKLLPPGQMDIFGTCGEPSPCPGNDETTQCHKNLFKRYKFYAAIENTRCNGYLTEKWVRGMVTGMVPLVWGGKNRSDYEQIGLPNDSFIHWDDYQNNTELAEALQRIGADKEQYNAFHRWRATHRVVTDEENNHRSLCELCGKLLDKNASSPHKYRDLGDWWFNNTCDRPKTGFGIRAEGWLGT